MTTAFESRPADWLGADEALAAILSGTSPLESEWVTIDEALGRAIAEDVVARWRLPPWDNSAMDGYAVRSEDIRGATAEAPVVLEVVERVWAGERASRTIRAGEAIRIMTGGPIPAGADTVVRVEDTDREEEPGSVCILDDRDTGRHVRPGGQDWHSGDVVLSTGVTVRPGTVGLLAAAGAARVRVTRQPRVAVLPTGNELFDIESPGDPDGVPESNSHMVAAQVIEAGGLAHRRARSRDDAQDLREALSAGNADVIVTIGGASMGEGDLVKRALDTLPYSPGFWRVKIRPGSPLSFGYLDLEGRRIPVLGLPGNPASAFVTFEVFARPLLRRLGGHGQIRRRIVTARAAEAMHSAEHLTHYLRVTFEEGGDDAVVRLTGPQGSGLVGSLGLAQGLAIVPEGIGSVPAGEQVEVALLGEDV